MQRSEILCSLTFLALTACARTPKAEPNGDIDVVALGDYLAVGTGAKDPRDGFIYRAVTSAAGPRLRSLESFGMPNALARDVVVLELEQLPVTTDLVVVALGANDFYHGTRADDFADDYAAVLAAIDRRAPQRVLLCCGIPDLVAAGAESPGASIETDERASVYDEVIALLCKRHQGTFVRLRGILAHGGRIDRAYVGSDRTHPSSLGYELLTPRLEHALRSALDSLPRRVRQPAR